MSTCGLNEQNKLCRGMETFPLCWGEIVLRYGRGRPYGTKELKAKDFKPEVPLRSQNREIQGRIIF